MVILLFLLHMTEPNDTATLLLAHHPPEVANYVCVHYRILEISETAE